MTKDEITAFVKSNVTVTNDDVKIVDSCFISKKDFKPILTEIDVQHPDSVVLKNRKWWHIQLEWATHNGLYMWGIEKDRTKDVDINYPLSCKEKIGYTLIGAFFWLIIK